MAGEEKKSVVASAQMLMLQSATFQDGQAWNLWPLGAQRFLLEAEQANQGLKGQQSGLAYVERRVFGALLHGLVEQGFDGAVSIALGDANKRIYFRNGHLVFSASNLMDDRLGEITYRAGLITLDQLTEAAVLVNRVTKFGRVLLNQGVFDSAQLWEALKLQVISVFQSVFLPDFVYLRLEPGEQLAVTTVVIETPTADLIDEAMAQAFVLKQFQQRLLPQSQVEARPFKDNEPVPVPGTFMGDFLDLMKSHPVVEDLLRHSKLARSNSLAALFDLLCLGYLHVKEFDVTLRGIDAGLGVKQVKSRIDAYQQILDGGQKAFLAQNEVFPAGEIAVFLKRQYRSLRSPMFVLDDGSLSPEAVLSIYAKARTSPRQAAIVASEMQGLVLFLLQIIGDLLPQGGWELKRSLQNLVT